MFHLIDYAAKLTGKTSSAVGFFGRNWLENDGSLALCVSFISGHLKKRKKKAQRVWVFENFEFPYVA